jgi:hypothetical protein
MKIHRQCKLEKCVSHDQTRSQGPLGHVYVHRTEEQDRTKGVAVACDGRRLVVVPVLFEDEDTDSFLKPDVLPQARKAANKKDEQITLGVNGVVKLSNGVQLPGVDPNALAGSPNYPNYAQVIPNAEPKLTIALNAHYLSEIADALGSDGYVVLQIVDELTPFRVSGGIYGAQAVLMPCRIK